MSPMTKTEILKSSKKQILKDAQSLVILAAALYPAIPALATARDSKLESN